MPNQFPLAPFLMGIISLIGLVQAFLQGDIKGMLYWLGSSLISFSIGMRV